MITPETIGETAEDLLPRSVRHDRPLLVVMSIMAFLAALALLLASMSIRATDRWQNDLEASATVQIYMEDGGNRDDVLLRALEILGDQDSDLKASPVSEDQSRELLEPWLGDLTLPEDLPLPILISLDTGPDKPIDRESIISALTAGGLTADVDDHAMWSARIKRATKAAQLAALFILFLVIAASIAASGFATQSALEARRKIIRVLTQVGAQDRFVAELFVRRFFIMGLKAGAIGSVGALVFAILIRLIAGGQREGALFPNISLSGGDIFLLILLPAGFGLISAIAAGWTSLQILQKDRRAR